MQCPYLLLIYGKGTGKAIYNVQKALKTLFVNVLPLCC